MMFTWMKWRSPRSLMGLALLFALSFSILSATGCNCSTPPPIPVPDGLVTDGGQADAAPPKQCKHLCDCLQGDECLNGVCTRTPGVIPLYCCTNPGCVQGQKCAHPDGKGDVCAGPKACSAGADCGTPSCRNDGTSCIEQVPECLQGRCSARPNPMADAVCDSAAGRCVKRPTGNCKGHCDCAQGQFCDKGTCKAGDSPVYCCTKAGCPAKAPCYQPDGAIDNCKGSQCKQASECGSKSCVQQASSCIEYTPTCTAQGTCTTETRRGSGTCNAATGTCRLTSPCKTHCDCEQGMTCVQGACAPLSSRRTFCCDKPGCLAGQACFTRDGAPGVCKGDQKCSSNGDCPKKSCREANDSTDCIEESSTCTSQGTCSSKTEFKANSRCEPSTGTCIPRPTSNCKTHCDCAQGQGCFNGQCGLGPTGTPVYCCDKAGCPSSAACFNKDGSSGSCPSGKQCKQASDCGRPFCRNQGHDCVVTTPTCNDQGSCATNSKTTADATCNSSNATCTPRPKSCSNHCDCEQGYYCAGRTCQRGSYPLYCCDNKGCPASANCVSRSGQPGFCPTACTSVCDCPAGQDCVLGKCSQTSTTVYCCDDSQNCPSGASCKDKSGKAGTCPQKPRPCKTACDCVQGEACTNGQCAKTSNPVYCCDKAGCPAGKGCVSKSNLSGTCPATCKTHCDCPQGQNCLQGRCNSDPLLGSAYCCSKSGCPLGQFCYNTNGQFGRCPTTRCTSPCDCNQGEDCRSGVCIRTQPPVYCCSASGCPSGAACKDKSNAWSTCKSSVQCKSPCDCNQGQDCYNGQCVGIFPAVYCCSKTGCPSGQACYDSNNKAGFCPSSACKTACDCPVQGQSCVRGSCAYLTGAARVYCCDKPFCPAGNKCEDKSGNLKTCSQAQCKNPCDCNQGEDCRNGQCVLVSPRVYCCTKAGCPRRAGCVQPNGSRSTCGGGGAP